MIAPFLDDPEVLGVYTKMVPAPEDNSVNTYLCELHVDPFTWFVFGNTAHPDHFGCAYPVIADKGSYIIYKFNVRRFPLIAWAQVSAFAIVSTRSGHHRRRYPAIILMIEQGKRLAYVQGGRLPPSSHRVQKLPQKYRARVLGNLYRRAFGMHNRTKYITSERKLRTYLWLIYGCTLVDRAACIRVVSPFRKAFLALAFSGDRLPGIHHRLRSDSLFIWPKSSNQPKLTRNRERLLPNCEHCV